MTTHKSQGRPKTENPLRDNRVGVMFTDEDVRLMNHLRGTTPLSLWIYQHIAPVLEGAEEAKAKEEPTE